MKKKVTTVSLTTERQELIEEIRKVVRVRGGGELRQATVIYAGLEALAEMTRSGTPIVDLPVMAFVGSSQVLPNGEIVQAQMRTTDLYGKCLGGVRWLRGFERNLFDVDTELISVGSWVKFRGFRFTPHLAGTTKGTELILKGPHRVQAIVSRTAWIQLPEDVLPVHAFDLFRVYPSPKNCRSCDNLVTFGRAAFEEELGDYCSTCEVANVPLGTEDRILLESNELK